MRNDASTKVDPSMTFDDGKVGRITLPWLVHKVLAIVFVEVATNNVFLAWAE